MNVAQDREKRGYLKRGGRSHRLCTIFGCSKQVQQGGVCCEHGAKTRRSPCSRKGCANFSQRGGLCRRHGAFLLAVCHEEKCKRIAKDGLYCDAHHAPSKDTQAKPYYKKISMAIGEPSFHDVAKGCDFGMHESMAMMHAHAPSNVEKAISEVDINDVDIITMYLVEAGDHICRTCDTT